MGKLRAIFDKQTKQKQKISKLVDQLLFDMGVEEITVDVNWGEDMMAIYDDDFVSFDLEYYTEPKHKDSLIEMKAWHDKNMPVDIMLPTFALLHEIGHIIASWSYDDFDKVFDNYTAAYNNGGKKNLTAYKQLSMEKDADREGYILYNKFYPAIKKFEQDLKKEIEVKNYANY